ncbi:MAG: hypothetical protein WAT79_08210 [Saprospiraceae bacterium]
MIYKLEVAYLVLFSLYMIASIVAVIMNFNLKKNGFEGIKYSECFSPKKHFSFFVGYTISLIPMYIIDQYVLRFYDPVCEACIRTGECTDGEGNKGCGCDPKAKACSPFEKCSFNYWGPIEFNRKKAIELLYNKNCKISIEYGKRSGEGTEISGS